MPTLEKPALIAPPAAPKPAAGPAPAGGVSGAEAALPTDEPEKKGFNWKLYLIVGGLVFFVIAMAATAIVAPQKNISKTTRPVIVPTPTTVPRPTIPDFPLGDPTAYANDPQILQLEGALKTYQRDLDTTDLREQNLDPPVLDMDVNFNIKKK